MGVYVNTYHCRVGMFVPGDGFGFMSLCVTFSRVVKLLGSLNLVRILLLIAGVEQNPGPAEKYIFRYQYLLVEIGTDILRKIFDVQVGSDFMRHLSANNNKKLQSLISAKIITTDQAQHLPPIDNSPQTINMDITLLTCLLRNVCGLRSQTDPVWKNPPPNDLSLEAELARFKECRNKLLHRSTVFLSEADLSAMWNELSQILNRLNTVSKIPDLFSLINDAEKMDIDEELKNRYDQAIKAWTEMDILLDRGIEELKLGQSEIKDGQSEISHRQTELKDLPDLKKSLENVVRRKTKPFRLGQAERLQELSNMMKRPKEQTFLDMDESDRKIFQLPSKLIRLGTAVLQKIFDYRVGNDFANYLTTNEAEEIKLHWLIDTNRITKLQVKLLPWFGQTTLSSYDKKAEKTLIPPSDQTPSSSSEKTFSSLKSTTFDISLLTVLLRYVCGLRAPNHLVWTEQPEDTDMSIEADINRLGLFRNRIIKLKHHNEENKLRNELHKILTRLGSGGGIKDYLLATEDAPFDYYPCPLHINMLEEWYANDQRVIQIDQKYSQTDFFKDSDDDAWTIDEENVSSLLSQGKLPNAKQLETMCKKFGSSSGTVRKAVAYICNTLQMTSHHIKRCWPAYVYDKNNETDTNLVTFVAVKYIEDKLNIDQIFGYNIYELFHGSHSAETSEMMERDIENADSSDDSIDKVDECVNNHALSLMCSHSNITLIAGSTVKSIGYLSEKNIILTKPCVAIYVHKKGYIPLGEEPFPTKLDEFDTDVRECVVELFRNDKAYEKHDQLLMGTSISNRIGCGTLGGFVEHPKYGLCGLTCAHVLCSDHLNCIDVVKQWPDWNPGIDVIQPASSNGTRIGEVVWALLRKDSHVGIDVALFRIHDRFPNSGQFAVDNPADFSVNDYNSGNIMRHGGIKIGKDCIKYGSETGRTKAKLFRRTSHLRTDHYTLYGQMMVENRHCNFAYHGDSGALAFVEVENKLNAIGVVVGGNFNDQGNYLKVCFLTPLSDILDALNEGNDEKVTMKQFEVADNEPMQE